MKKYFLSIFCILNLVASAGQKDLYIKISVFDCATCTSALEKIIENFPEKKLVMDGQFAMDSIDFYDKYNLAKYKNKIIWNDSLYNSITKNTFSEIVVYNGNVEIYRNLLKGFTNTDIETLKNAFNDKCDYKLPSIISIRDEKHFYVIKNFTLSKFYLIEKSTNKMKSLQLDTSLIKDIYKMHGHSDALYKNAMQAAQLNSLLKPNITSLYFVNDTTYNMLISTCVFKQAHGEDSIFGKDYTIISFEKSTKQIATPIHFNQTGFNENTVFSYNNSLYDALILPNVEMKNAKIIAQFDKKVNKYELKEIKPFLLPDYLFHYSIKYNNANPIYSNGYVTLPFLNYIIDLANNRSISLPFENSVYQKNIDLMKTMKIKYGILDLKFNKTTDEFTILYQFDDELRASIFKSGAKEFSKTITLYDESSKPKYLKTQCLSFDGKRISYVLKNEDCIKEVAIDELIKHNIFNDMDR